MTELELTALDEKVDIGIKAAVAEAIEEHRRAGRSIAIWRDGQVVILTPDQIPVRPVDEVNEVAVKDNSWTNKPNSA